MDSAETHIKSKPRVSSAENDFEILPLGEVLDKVSTTGLGSLYALDNGIGIDVGISLGKEVLDILTGLLYVTFDVHGEAWRLGDGQPEVEGNASRNSTQTDEEAPAEVNVNEVFKIIR